MCSKENKSHFQQELAVTFSALGKKINRASAQPAQGPSLKPRSLGKAASLCFPVCGQLAGKGARGERPLWKKILKYAKLCRLEASRGGLWLTLQDPSDKDECACCRLRALSCSLDLFPARLLGLLFPWVLWGTAGLVRGFSKSILDS